VSVKDDPKARVKAADAKLLLEDGATASEFARVLGDLHDERGFVATAAIRFDGTPAFRKMTLAAAERDRDVLHLWFTGLVQHHVTDAVQALDAALIIAVRPDGCIDTATWGRDKTACDAIAAWRTEQMKRLPRAPFETWFGWGHEGKPTRLKPAEYASLTAGQQAYVDKNTHPDAR
jgi:hypothetical protein